MSDFTERIRHLSQQKLVLLAQHLQSRLDVMERAGREPIAIIGLSCRFPAARDAEQLWDVLRNGVDAIAEVPRDRWDVDALYDARRGAMGRICTRNGGFLEQIDQFDPQFFGISPREATVMDPQQRLLLEVAWEALERAGIPPDGLDGSRTGVFVGISGFDFAQMLLSADQSSLDMYTASGASHAIASGRLSYTLGLQGPSVSIDTACSSSLVAVHLACQSVRSGESRLALAAGVNLMVTPETTISLSRGGMLAPDGRCKTFDASADGFSRGEGCGVVILKGLSDAQADGDRILAVIRGTAVNQDGRSSGITAPNGPAQEAVIREALERSGAAPGDIDYVETHGTGTVLGDPIEVRALGAVFGPARGAADPLLIGSVKTNLGHLESSAGIAGLIKTVLALQHEEIPPHLHLNTPNPNIEWDRLPIAVTRERRAWRRSTRRRVAGVSSFGFSGTNAHVVVEEAPRSEPNVVAADRPRHLLALSAATGPALRDLAGRYVSAFSASDAAVADRCFSANTGRSKFSHRLAIAGTTAGDLERALSTFARSGAAPDVDADVVTTQDPPEIAFLFTGQGSQYVGMGRQLFETEPAFRRTMQQCDEILRPQLGESLLEILYPAAGNDAAAEALLTNTRIAQPALFAVEFSMAQLWQAWGITPAAVAGHSLGEYVAACVSGVFSLEDGLRLVVERARLMAELPPGGAMAAVFVDEARAAKAIAAYRQTVAIAAVNGEAHTVLSGREDHLTAVLAGLTAEGATFTRLKVSHAFHSPLIEPMLHSLERAAGRIAPGSPRIPLVSNVTGRCLTADQRPDAKYWKDHARSPVRFADTFRSLHALGCTVFVEVGPHPVLLGMGRECLAAGEGRGVRWIPSLRRGREDWQLMLGGLGALWTAGATIDWRAFDREFPRERVVMPTYPFQRQRYWPEVAPRQRPAAETTDGYRDWLYGLEWKPLDALGDSAAAAFLSSPATIAGQVEPLVDSLAAEHGVSVYDDLYPLLDDTCAAYICDALRRLGWDPRVGDRIAADPFRERLGVVVRHRALFARLLEILGEDGLLHRDGADWRVARVPDPLDAAAMVEDLRRRFPQCRGELNLTARCAGHLVEVLRGERDPMQLLFPEGSLAETEALYQHAPGFRLFNALIAHVCGAAAARWPDQRPLRVLELGGGTGSTTASVLPALAARRPRYVFTDVSRLFTLRAQEKFAAFDFVEYRTLDIEQDPRRQGFESDEFDLILASNVLHATADLRVTLQRVRSLLAPGGLLVLLEGTRPQRFGDLTVGLTDGWWCFNDDLRPSYALLSAPRWVEALADCGFDDPVILPGARSVGPALFDNQSIVLARAPRMAAVRGAAEAAKPLVVLFTDDGAAGDGLARALRARGHQVVRVVPREAWTVIDTQTFGLDVERSEAVNALFEVLGPAVNDATLVHLRASEGRWNGSADAVEERVRSGCRSALALVQALAGRSAAQAPRLVFITTGAQTLDSTEAPADAAQAALWGFVRVVAHEHPELATRLVDLEPGGDDAAVLSDIFSRPANAEAQTAVRGGRSHGLRFVELADRVRRLEPSRFSSDAGYLVTGGLSGLGLAVAEWMVERGARHLVLVGRSAPGEKASVVLERLRMAGADVHIELADVASRDDLERVFAALDARLELRGIMHCAGITDDAAILQMTWDRFERVMAAKVRGTWHLHELTATRQLDHFVLFSSGAALLGSRGQSNHAAANAFLDALAHHRRALGLAALSVNWGAWSEIGAATRGGVLERVEGRGVRRITPDGGLAALDQLMAGGTTQAAVLPIVWADLLQHAVETDRPLFEAFLPGPAQEAEKEPRATVLAGLADASPARARMIIARAVECEAAMILGLRGAESIDPRQPLSELGLDSLMAVELRNELARLFERPQPATLLFNYPTIGELVDYLVREHAVSSGSPGDAPAPGPSPEAGALDELSEDELASLLASKLSAGLADRVSVE